MTVVAADRQGSVAFTTGDMAPGYTITEVKLQLATALASTGYTPAVTLHEDNSGVPADAVLFTFTNPNPLPAVSTSFTEVTFTSGAGYEVAPGTIYHIRLADAVTNADAYEYYFAQMTTSNDEDALTDPGVSTSGSGWEIADASYLRLRDATNLATWTVSNASIVFRIGIRGFISPGVTVDTDPGTDGTQSDKLTIVEGMTDTYTVALDSAPSADVTVTPTAPAGLSVSPAVLTFSATDFDAQTFTITADADE